jgi:cytochrome b561/polyisoprenoid-binding protein YceI
MTPARYSKSAMALHWLIAALMAFQYGLGEAFAHMPRGKALFDVAQFHKSIGIAILLFTVIRLGVRIAKPRPAMLADSIWATWLAVLVHVGFYFMLIAVPLSGWLAASTASLNIPTVLFNTVPWPDFPFVQTMEATAKHGLHEWAENMHGITAKLALLLFVLHIVGALRHQLLLKEAVIERMLPLRALSPLAGSALIVALSGGAFGLMQWAQTPGVAPKAYRAAVTPVPAKVQDAIRAPEAAALSDDAEKLAAEEAAKVEAEKAKVKQVEKEEADAIDPDAIAAGETPRWAVAPGGQLGFTTSWTGSPVSGSFGNWSADVRFNPDALPQSKIRITIALGSANTGDGERDNMLKGSDFFNSGSHAQATWTSGAIKHLGGNRYRAEGQLNLRGVTKPVPLTFTLDIKGKVARVSGNASLRRLAFGVGQGEFAATSDIPDPVSVRFSFRAKRP